MIKKQENVKSSDPATFVVIKNSLYAAAEEMKIVLAKTAYSPILKVAGDYSCGIFDATVYRGGLQTKFISSLDIAYIKFRPKNDQT